MSYKFLFGAPVLRKMLWVCGFTYPLKTLSRRLALLTGEERELVQYHMHQIEDHLIEIDDVLATRAEAKNDL